MALIRAASESGRIAASQGVQVVEISPDIFVAYGASGNKYVVDLDHHVCSCPDFQNRGRTAGPCKHLAAAILKRGEMKGKE
jgi:predicted nucleic acid-binding Zn finger protein